MFVDMRIHKKGLNFKSKVNSTILNQVILVYILIKNNGEKENWSYTILACTFKQTCSLKYIIVHCSQPH